MQVTLIFNLLEEQQKHRDALDGTLWKNVVYNIDNKLRNLVKYSELDEKQQIY